LIQPPKTEAFKGKKHYKSRKSLNEVNLKANENNYKNTKKAIKNDDIILLDFDINTGLIFNF
jgi:hypothetical protein